MAGMGDGYVGTAQDAVRIRRLEMQREAERRKIEELMSKTASTKSQTGLLQFGSGTSEILETREQYLEKRVNIRNKIEEEEKEKLQKMQQKCVSCSRVDMEHNISTGSLSFSDNVKVGSKLPFNSAQILLVSTHPDVYEPCDDSFALVDALLADRANLLLHQPRLCLEVGCGSGYVITSLALMLGQENSGAQYFATDINQHAAEVTRETLEAHGVDAEVITTDIASGLEKRLAGTVDLVVVNPPYVPTPEDEVGVEGITCSWAGGFNGCSVINRILPVVDNLLSDKGWFYMVTIAANNPVLICRVMREKGYTSRIILQRSTEEECINVIKFWRESSEELDDNQRSAWSTDSWFSKLSLLSLWRSVAH